MGQDTHEIPVPPILEAEQEDGLVIRTHNLTKRFRKETAVNDLTFSVPRGTIFGFIGPSGSGKTTTIRLLTGVYEPTEGEAVVLGHHPSSFTQATRARIGYMPQLFVLYPDLTAWENLNFASSIYGVKLRRGDRLREVLDFVELTDHRRKVTRELSGGMQRRLSLAATLAHDPDLIFLDEPTAGIDPVLRRKFWQGFKELKGEGRTLFITTQYVSEAAHCDLVGVLDEGQLLAQDTPAGLRRRAFGGEVVDLRLRQRPGEALLERMRELPFTCQVTPTGQTDLRVTVQEASTAIPELVAWYKDNDVALESVQEYQPPFDDVFVALLEQEDRS